MGKSPFVVGRGMFGGDGTDPLLPVSMAMGNTRVPYNTNAVPPKQLDVVTGCSTDIMDVVGNKNSSMLNLPMKVGWWDPVFSQHKLPVTLPDTVCLDGGGQGKSMPKQIPVSTGLRLSYGEEYNSSVSSARGNTVTNLSSMLPHGDILHTELAHLNDELDRYIRVQEENIRKGISELKHQHTISLLNALEKEVSDKLHQKDIEIENLHCKNKELTEKIKHISAESQLWQFKAAQNELRVSDLKSKINQLSLQGAVCLKEGCGESMVDDAVSSCNQNPLDHLSNLEPLSSRKESMKCKACNDKEISVLLLPCRHLCICIDCDAFVYSCPVCGVKKAGGLQVYMV